MNRAENGENRERFAVLEGACGAQTLYMTPHVTEPENQAR
jgi:hypothetical protein